MLDRNDAIAVKLLSRDISHKSDVGGVVLGVRTPETRRRRRRHRRARRGQGAGRGHRRVHGAGDGRSAHAHELIIGVSEDKLFGPIILFGAGGTSVEVVADTAIALPPLDMNLAHDLIGQTRIARLLAGYRDRPAADMEAVALTLIRVSQMIVDCPEIAWLDINPLLVDADGASRSTPAS